MSVRDLAICIRAVDYSETSQVLRFFTRTYGKVSVIAKGSKRLKSNFEGPIEIFTTGRIIISTLREDGLSTLTEFEQDEGFRELSLDMYRYYSALFAAELVDKLTESQDPHPDLFDILYRFLLQMKTIRDDRDKTTVSLRYLVGFQIRLLNQVGLAPVTDRCVNCKTPYNVNWPGVYFSSSANGFLCRDCEMNFPDKLNLTKKSAQLFRNPDTGEAGKKHFKETEKILIYHFTELLNKPPKMAKYILEK